jgi:HEAT repeat protein
MQLFFSIFLGLTCLTQDRPSAVDPAQQKAESEHEVWMDKSVEKWMKMLDTSDAATRRARFGMYIGTANSKMDHLRPVFVRALGDPDNGVRMAAAGFILMSNVYSEAEIRRASDVLGQSLADPKVRSRAIYSLHNDPSKAIPTLPAIARVIGQIEDEEDEWRFVTEIFARLGGQAAPAVDELIGALKSGDARAKARAATLLASIGEAARAAVPALLVTIRFADRDVVFASYDALRRIDPKSQPQPSPAVRYISAEVAILEGPDLMAGFRALQRLSKVGQEAIAEIPAILRFADRFLKEPDPSGWNGIFVAGDITRDRFGDALFPALLAQIRDDRIDTACIASILIGNGREAYADVIPALTETLGRTSGKLKGNVATCLGSIARKDHRAVPTLVRLVKDADPLVRLGAINGLKLIENPTPEAIAAVKAAKDDPDKDVRQVADLALRIMGVEPLTNK